MPIEMDAANRWRIIACIAGIFSLFAAGALLFIYLNTVEDDPLQSTQLKYYKDKLRSNPIDEQVKKEIRNLDLQLRQRYFRQSTQMKSGVYLLLGGVVICIFSAGRVVQSQKRSYRPGPERAAQAREAARTARWSVAISGVAVGTMLFLLSFFHGAAMPKLDKMARLDNPEVPPPSDCASLEELKQNWPRFRGPDGGGMSLATNSPSSWDARSGDGIVWKIPSPAIGFNSPIVWNGRVFLSGGDASKREVFCLDGETGRILWQQLASTVGGATAPEIPESTGYAASTMATDGRRVYAFFANGDLAALDLEGRPVWSKNVGPLKNPYGHAASLVTWRDRVILQLDQGESQDGKSKLVAFDGRTGQVVWERPRKVGSSWSSPIIIESGGKAQVVALAVPWAISYDVTDGTELWRVEALGGEVTPSPIFAGGILFVASPSEKLMAIRPDGTGDVTKTHVAWTSEENVPDITCPVSSGDLIFTITTGGMLTCLDAKSGKKVWEHDFETDFHASPALAGTRLYLFSQKGTAIVVEAAQQFKEIFRTEMPDEFHASPAFAQNKIFLRGRTNVWCLGATSQKLANGK